MLGFLAPWQLCASQLPTCNAEEGDQESFDGALGWGARAGSVAGASNIATQKPLLDLTVLEQ